MAWLTCLPSPVIRFVVDIAQPAEEADLAVRKISQRIRESMGARPTHPGKRMRRPPRSQSHQPVAAILGRANNGIGRAQGTKGGVQVGYSEARDIAADQHNTAAPIAVCR